MKHKFLLLYTWFVRLALIWLPDQPSIMKFRGMLYGLAMPNCGTDFQVSASVILRNLENISVGNNVYLAPNVIVNAITTISLSDEVMVGFNSVLVSGNHSISNGSYRYGQSNTAPISLGKGSWVSANCTVVAGANLAAGSLLAANSVLLGDGLASGLYGGVPARKLEKKQ